MNAEVECPRCHRISFEWERNSSCTECHWTIRPSSVEKPYGYDVLIEKRGTNLQTATEVRHYKGNEVTARRRARPLGRVLAVVPLSEQTWLTAYGEGRM
jgi:hypothetical protein